MPELPPAPTLYGPASSLLEIIDGLTNRSAPLRIEAIRATWSANRLYGDWLMLVPPLVNCLQANPAQSSFTTSESARIRGEATVALGLIGPPAKGSIPALLQILSDPDEWARASAVDSIRRIQLTNREAVAAFIEAMRDPSPRVRAAANAALLEVGPANTNVASAFMRAAQENATQFSPGGLYQAPPEDIVLACQEFFHRLGPQQKYLTTQLADMARQPYPGLQRVAIIGLNAIGDIPEDLVPLLVDSLPDDVAREALKMLGPKAKSAVPRLTVLMENPQARPVVADILAAIGSPEAAIAIPAFEACIKKAQFPELFLCEGLLKLEPSSKVALLGFEKLILRPDLDVASSMAARARLIQAGRSPSVHLGYIATQLDNPQERVQACAIRLLLECDARGPLRTNVVSRLFALLETGKDEWSFNVAQQALERLGPQDKAWVPRLVNALDAFPNLHVMVALGHIGPDAALALPRLRYCLRFRSQAADAYEEANGTLDPWSLAVRKTAEETIPKIAIPIEPEKKQP
jgi:HEAT repeat protein